MKDAKNAPQGEKQKANNDLDGIKTVVFDLDGTLYDKSGLAKRMVRRLWWCLPMIAAERLARRNMHYVQYASGDEFYDAFFGHMSRGHWWNKRMAATWYMRVFMPTMVRLIRQYHCPRAEVMALVQECKAKGLKMAIYSDYGCVIDKLEALGIDPSQFDLLVDAPSLGALKPSEPCARRVLEMLEAHPQETLFVGDREDKDGASAKAVGAKFLLIN